MFQNFQLVVKVIFLEISIVYDMLVIFLMELVFMDILGMLWVIDVFESWCGNLVVIQNIWF